MGAGSGAKPKTLSEVALRGGPAARANSKAAGGGDLLKILDQRDKLKEKARDEAGTLQTRLLARRQLGALDEQIKSAIEEAGAKGGQNPGEKQPFDEDKNTPGIQAMPIGRDGAPPKGSAKPQPGGLGGRGVAPQPAPATPAPATPAPGTPAPAPNTAADDAERLKLAEEQRQRDIADARAKELARRDEIRKRRGSGLESFLTSGLRGLPTTLAQFLGV